MCRHSDKLERSLLMFSCDGSESVPPSPTPPGSTSRIYQHLTASVCVCVDVLVVVLVLFITSTAAATLEASALSGGRWQERRGKGREGEREHTSKQYYNILGLHIYFRF